MSSTQTDKKQLSSSFYREEDVVDISRALIGKVLVSTLGNCTTSGIIVETEAYRAPDDKACHAYDNRRTERTEIMFAKGGHAYIYLCYGIHHLFNVVTGPPDRAQAVLIRALQPLEGIDYMQSRRAIQGDDKQLTNGPGKLSEALQLHTNWSGVFMPDDQAPFWIEDRGLDPKPDNIQATKRIGIDYAEECTDWPWRFIWKGNPWVSGA